ncbi:class II aldolase/adducin family protein [Bacillus sp. Marseille-P3661]|uniref:class II aldolase/adducin family protein n=1 Tax=Bacillus sp. Marseille-P3661 TaxID=1936234 RepID=UPI000C83BE58|nr:class II aldolase/adducin family protein [Bacillus sp. Marseille-P3661]
MSEQNINELKLQLAKSIRMLENIQLLDMNGHVSVRLPGTDYFLINARKASRASVKADDIVVCDLNGQLVEGISEPPSEVYIHNAIYKRRSDVSSIVHGHPHWQTVLGIADIPFQPVFMLGSFVEQCNMFEDSSLINTPEQGEELAAALGNDPVLQLRHHGNVVVSDSLKSAFAATVYVEEHAKKLYYATLAAADKIKVLEGDNLVRTRETAWTPKIVEKVWNYYHEKSERNNVFAGI